MHTQQNLARDGGPEVRRSKLTPEDTPPQDQEDQIYTSESEGEPKLASLRQKLINVIGLRTGQHLAEGYTLIWLASSPNF